MSNILFVLSQNEVIINAVKTSILINLFKNIVFVESELYDDNTTIFVQQSVDNGGAYISKKKTENFLTNMKTYEHLQNILPENIYILSIENFLSKQFQKEEVTFNVYIQFSHNGICTNTSGIPAKFPQSYLDDLKSMCNTIIYKNEDELDIILGYDKSIGLFIANDKNCPEDNWCKEFNSFDRTEQIVAAINFIEFRPIIMSRIPIENNFIDTLSILSDNTLKTILQYVILKKIKEIKIDIDYVVGLESNGLIFGSMIATLINVPFVQIKNDDIQKNSIKLNKNILDKNILVVDDILEDDKKIVMVNNLLQLTKPNTLNFFILGKNNNYLGELYKKIVFLF